MGFAVGLIAAAEEATQHVYISSCLHNQRAFSLVTSECRKREVAIVSFTTEMSNSRTAGQAWPYKYTEKRKADGV